MIDLLRCALPASPDPTLAEAARRPFLRQATLEALTAARERPSHAAPILSRWFRKTRRLGSHDRRVVSEAVYGVIRHQQLLARAGASDDPALIDTWTRLVAGDRFPALQADTPARDYATALSLPLALATEWLDQLGPEDAAALAQQLSTRPPMTVRANRLRCDRDQLAERLAAEGLQTRPCAEAPDGLHILGRANLQALASFRHGWFEVQDESSQLLAQAIPLLPGQRVVDLCAGAGGKSLALAARGARVQAWDMRQDALSRLKRRAKRAGARVRVANPTPAPVVLVDAPCSGTGRLARDPALRWGLELQRAVPEQRRLLDQAAHLVQPGGVLVYATCSLARVENEHRPPAGDWILESERWLWPHQTGTDGFAWRVWRHTQASRSDV